MCAVQVCAPSAAARRRRCPRKPRRYAASGRDCSASVSRVRGADPSQSPASSSARPSTTAASRAHRPRASRRARDERRSKRFVRRARRASASASLATTRGSASRQAGDRRLDQRAHVPPASERVAPAPRAPSRSRAPRRWRPPSGRLSLQGSPSAATTSTTSPAASASSGSVRQRERMVGRTWPGRCATIRNQRALRRLLDHLQERVGAVAVQVLGAIDDADAPAAERRPTSGTAAARARTSSTADFRAEILGLSGLHCVAGSAKNPDARGRRAAAPPASRGSTRKSRAALHRWRGRVGIGEHEAREAPGERRLADAFGGRRSARRGRAARCDRRPAARPRPRVADERCARNAGGARLHRRRSPDVFPRRPLHGVYAFAAAAGSSRPSTTRPDRGATSSSAASASMTAQRCGSARGDVEEGLAQRLVEGEPLALKSVGRVRAAPRGRARQSLPGPAGRASSVRSGRLSPTATSLELRDQARRQLARGALIGARRIGESVANHPGAPLQRRRDRLVDMVDPRGGEQQRLGSGPNLRRRAGEDHLAQCLGMRRAARLARTHDRPGQAPSARPRARFACTDLPAPSPPSSVMKRPLRPCRHRLRQRPPDRVAGQLHAGVERARASDCRPRRPRRSSAVVERPAYRRARSSAGRHRLPRATGAARAARCRRSWPTIFSVSPRGTKRTDRDRADERHAAGFARHRPTPLRPVARLEKSVR